jgi:hypothetical protein
MHSFLLSQINFSRQKRYPDKGKVSASPAEFRDFSSTMCFNHPLFLQTTPGTIFRIPGGQKQRNYLDKDLLLSISTGILYLQDT